MIHLYKKYICVFFLALLAINHTLYLSHIMLAHNHDGCSHHKHYQVKKLDTSNFEITSFEYCVICASDLFNLFETSINVSARHARLDIIQLTLGQLKSVLFDNWITKSFPKRGPPFKS